MALMTTSGSMPFSLASASMVCCSGFAMIGSGVPSPVLKFHFQIRARDDVHWHLMAPAVIGHDNHRARAATVDTADEAAKLALQEHMTVHGFAHDQLRPSS